MPVPTFDQLLRPILKLSAKDPVTRQSATAAMVLEFRLTDEEQQETVTSGALRISNRTGWAMSHLKKGGLISMVAKYTYRATDKGIKYLKSHPGPITPGDLRQIEGWKEAWDKKKRPPIPPPIGTLTPEEMIDQAVVTLGDSLSSELLDQLSQINPYRFEQVVIDLLFAMGYGGSRAEAAQVTKKSGDEGIDGIINEDRLGLDVIYVQAKRWKTTVGRPDIQNFVGALAGKQAQKGVFITTSEFAAGAIVYATAVPQKVILIDGTRLAALMIEHGIGVATTRTIAIQRIDSDYFEDE